MLPDGKLNVLPCAIANATITDYGGLLLRLSHMSANLKPSTCVFCHICGVAMLGSQWLLHHAVV